MHRSGLSSRVAEADALKLDWLLAGPLLPAIYHLPNGFPAVFEALIQQVGLDDSIRINMTVTSVGCDALVTWQDGQQQFDRVTVTAQSNAAISIVPPAPV